MGVSQEAGLSPWRQMAQGGYGHSLKILQNANRERQETAVRCQVLFGMRLFAVCSDVCEYSSAAFLQRRRRIQSVPNRSSARKFPSLTFLGLYNILKTGIGFLRYLCASEFKSFWYNVAANKHFFKRTVIHPCKSYVNYTPLPWITAQKVPRLHRELLSSSWQQNERVWRLRPPRKWSSSSHNPLTG